MITKVFSNQIERLFEELKKTLYKNTDPFAKRMVVVPSPAVKSWVMLQLASTIGVAAGIEVVYLDSIIHKITGEKREKSLLELSLSIQTALPELKQPEIQKYLRVKNSKRLVALSETLAHLFKKYEMFGPINENDNDWQAELWRKVGKNDQNKVLISNKIHIHLFSLSFIPKKQFRILEEFSQNSPVHYYILSPCQVFWSDIKSDRESRFLIHKYKNQKEDLEMLLFDRNPLLANFGRMGREMAAMIEESSGESQECYTLPSWIQDFPEYQEHLVEGTFYPHDRTLLSSVQCDLLLLRNPNGVTQIKDDSIIINCASSSLREIQILLDTLVGLFDKNADLTPGDIVVMAPNIAEYEPYIRCHFEGEIDYQIMDLPLFSQSALVQGFIHLISLPQTRWDSVSILQLLEFEPFIKKFKFSLEEKNRIRKWTKEAGILWGNDSEHRDDLLKKSHCLQGMVDGTPVGTWSHGFDRLLYGLIEDSEDSIELSQGELLGRWIQIVESLKTNLKILDDGTTLTPREWSKILSGLLETYFSETESNLSELIKAFENIIEGQFNFGAIKYHLENAINNKKVCYREPYLNCIRFCSMVPMRTLPAKVIVLLGMNEGAFPRLDKTLSLNKLSSNASADYCPTQTDFDRYLFLEILLSVRKHLIISYSGYSKRDNKEQEPSLLIEELISYLEKFYTISVIKHPFLPYDKRYFDGEELYSYSQKHYQAALAYYHKQKIVPHKFLDTFSQSQPPIKCEIIDIKNLSALARNSVKIYFNKTLGIYLERDEDKIIKTEEEFSLSSLEKSIITKTSLKQPLNEILNRSKKLPFGIFKELALEKITKSVDELHQNLENLGIKKNEIFDFDFTELVDSPERLESGNWRLPPLEIHNVKIVGKLQEVSPQGLIGHIEDNKWEIVKLWPLYLIYLLACKKYDLPYLPQLIFSKSGTAKTPFFDNPENYFEKYLDYYFLSMENPSPLIPEWIPEFLKENNDSLIKKIKSDISDRSEFFFNEYVSWSLSEKNLLNEEQIGKSWKPLAEALFKDIYTKWYDQ